MDGQIHDIPLDQIIVSPENVRKTQREKGIEELAASIDKLGLMQPVVLRGSREEKPPYELVIGQRRLLAYQYLKKPTIRAIFCGPITDTDAKIRSLTENTLRLEPNRADTMDAVAALYRECGSVGEVAERTGMWVGTVRKYLRVQEYASPHMQELLSENKVALDDVQRAVRAAQYDSDKADTLLDLVIAHGLNPTQQTRLVAYGEQDRELAPEELVSLAEEPRLETKVMVLLPKNVREALDHAATEMNTSAQELAALAVREWLSDKGYFDG